MQLNHKHISFSALCLGAWLSTNALADADIAVQTSPKIAPEATAHVDLCVVVPEVLIFGIGPTGDTISEICWDCAAPTGYTTGNNQTYTGDTPAFTDPAFFSGQATARITDGGAGSSVSGATGTLPVYLFSNGGADVTIEITDLSGGDVGGGTLDALDHTLGATTGTIPISDFAAVSTNGDIPHPTALAQASTATLGYSAGTVFNLNDTWEYTYTPTTTPIAGTYKARVTYVASTP